VLLSKLPTRIVCIAAVFSLVTGCSLSSSSPTPATNMQQGPTVAMTATQRPSSVQTEGFLNGEVFKANKVVIQNQSCSTGNILVNFSATGSASGPYPGTFTETGKWTFEDDAYGREHEFSAPFKISSKSRLITGEIIGRVHGISCHSVDGNRRLGVYFNGTKTGSASMLPITANGLRQTFH
jgi:hypothetical protein